MKKFSIIALIPGMIIFFGTFQKILYYNSFNINIVEFIELQELLVSFMDDIILLFITALILLIFILFKKETILYKDKTYINLLEIKSFWSRLWLYIKACFIYWIILLIFMFIMYSILITKLFFLFTFLILSSGVILPYIVIEIERFYKKTFGIFMSISTLELIRLLFILLLITYFNTSIDIIGIKDYNRYYGSKIITKENEVIYSDSTNYYIGKTNNYIFFYSQSLNCNRIIPTSEIKELKLKSKRNKNIFFKKKKIK